MSKSSGKSTLRKKYFFHCLNVYYAYILAMMEYLFAERLNGCGFKSRYSWTIRQKEIIKTYRTRD